MRRRKQRCLENWCKLWCTFILRPLRKRWKTPSICSSFLENLKLMQAVPSFSLRRSFAVCEKGRKKRSGGFQESFRRQHMLFQFTCHFWEWRCSNEFRHGRGRQNKKRHLHQIAKNIFDSFIDCHLRFVTQFIFLVSHADLWPRSSLRPHYLLQEKEVPPSQKSEKSAKSPSGLGEGPQADKAGRKDPPQYRPASQKKISIASPLQSLDLSRSTFVGSGFSLHFDRTFLKYLFLGEFSSCFVFLIVAFFLKTPVLIGKRELRSGGGVCVWWMWSTLVQFNIGRN